jgi:hypothetical protein
MAKISEVNNIVNNGQSIKLDTTNVFQFLQALVGKGYKASKTLTIKDGAMLHNHFEVLTGTKESESQTFPEIFNQVLVAVTKANEEGAYDLNDAAVLDRLISFVTENFKDKLDVDKVEL